MPDPMYYIHEQNAINKAKLAVSVVLGLSILGFVLYKSLVYNGSRPFDEISDELGRNSDSGLTEKLAN